MKIRIKTLLFWLLVIILAVGIWYAWPRLPIITGYAAKNMCSGIFLSERTQEQIEQQELNFFPINLARNVVDMENRSVTSSLLGLVKRTAVYREGLGSVLVIGYDEEILKNQTLTNNAFFPENPDTVPWPLGDRIADTVPAGLDREKLAEVVNGIFDRPGEDLKKTFSAIVVYKGQLVAEQYTEGVTEATRLVSWSMAKSVTNALVGILVKEGKMKPDAPVGIPEWENDERSSVTLDHLMRMNSGLEWDEDYFDLSHVTKLLYMEPDMYAFAVESPLAHEPGTHWYYSSGSTNIICGLIRRTFDNDSDYHHFPRRALFNPTGMRSAVFETDPSGTFVGSSYIYATTRDWARFGLLYLNNGVFAGDTLLPEGWVEYTCRPTEGSGGQYGAMFWLNRSGEFTDVPEDMLFADGFKGQRIFILPSHDLVVVRMGYSSETVDFNRFLADILALLPD